MANTKWLQQNGANVIWGSGTAVKLLSQQTNGSIAWELGERSRKCLGADSTGTLKWEVPVFKNGLPIDDGLYTYFVQQFGAGAPAGSPTTVLNGDNTSYNCLFIEINNQGQIIMHAEPSIAATYRRGIGIYFVLLATRWETGSTWNAILGAHRFNVCAAWAASDLGQSAGAGNNSGMSQIVYFQFWSAVQTTAANIGASGGQQAITVYRCADVVATGSVTAVNLSRFYSNLVNLSGNVVERFTGTNMNSAGDASGSISCTLFPCIIRAMFGPMDTDLLATGKTTRFRIMASYGRAPATPSPADTAFTYHGGYGTVPNQVVTSRQGPEPIYDAASGMYTAFAADTQGNINTQNAGTNTVFGFFNSYAGRKPSDGVAGASQADEYVLRDVAGRAMCFLYVSDNYGNMLGAAVIDTVTNDLVQSTPNVKTTGNLLGRIMTKNPAWLSLMDRFRITVGMASDNNLGLLVSSEQYGDDVNLYKPCQFLSFFGQPRY